MENKIELEITRTSENKEYIEIEGKECNKIDSIEKLKQLISLIG
jgi:hypothetical protein